MLNCANGVSQSIIRALTQKGVQVQVGDLYPSFAAVQNFLYFKDTLSLEQQALITSDHQVETKSDLKRLLRHSDQVILTAHNYYTNVPSKEKVLSAALESLSASQKALVIAPLEHLHYSQTSPALSLEKVVQQGRGYNSNVTLVESELLYGEDASTLHTLVAMVVNKKLDMEAVGQNYISPVDSEDFSKGIMTLLEETSMFSNYVFRGQSTHMIKDLVDIIEQKVDKSQVLKDTLVQRLFLSDEEKNV